MYKDWLGRHIVTLLRCEAAVDSCHCEYWTDGGMAQ